ncbi:MAG: hypothetical protein OEY34_00480, partial [Cyclobacteriaceae bacterium]|nr:hypothetical protein [Cyclobacteriaceae bacterium]
LDGLYGKQSGIIPNSTVQNKDFNLSLNNYHGIQNLHINSSLKFNESKGNLLLHGGNYAQIIESVYLTPPTFDNANNLSRTLATSNPSSYQLVDNSKRSYAPAYADNPYGLINTIPDHEKFQRISGALNMDYGPPKKITLNFRNLVEKQWNSLLYGMAPGYSRTPLGRITEREDHSTFINSNLSSTYTNPIHEDGELKITLSFQTNYQDYNLSRYEGVGYTMSDFEQRINAQSQNTFDAKIARITYETLFSVFYDYDNFIKSTFSLKKYYSNTLNTQRTNLYPSFNFSFDPNEIIDSYIFDRLKAYVSIGSNIQEASLIYPDKSFLTTDLSVENYHAFYESRELLPQENLSPETEIKFDAGLNIIAFYNLYIDFSYYTHHASNIILPVQTNGIYELTNAASVNHRGTTLSIDYAPYMYDGYLSLGIDFSKGRSLVKEVYNSSTPLSIAGFNTIQRVITPGENYGVIYGTGYLRNANNEIIIDNEGFPIEDNQLRIIGDPTPNWMGAISGQYSINNFEIGILIEHKNGGDRWNGTRAMLDYLGRSTETAELRNTSNHIFEGVDLLGNPNLIPVSFLDTSLPVEKNRWTRYGWDGVGEEYIEDASWTKVSEFSVSHTWRRLPKTKINSIILSGIINNFLMFSKYKGVIPSSNLFGYAQGNGLDLFNTPETRRYSISFTLNF